MRIAIDMQGAQTESRFRGIGRYTLSLALAMARNRGAHDIVLVLNGMFPETIEPIRAAFDGVLPAGNIHVWYASGSVRMNNTVNAWRHTAAEYIREAFIASLRPDVIHITSLFEGYGDDAVISLDSIGTAIPTVITLYDLIPLLNAETYLKHNPAYEKYYRSKIEIMKRANRWLAISESSADEGRRELGLPDGTVVNISAACDAVFRPMVIEASQRKRLLGRLGITGSFVLYSGGADVRKNLTRLIRAYASMPIPLREQNQLVLVGKVPNAQVAELLHIARSAHLSEHELLLSGYICDEDLAMLYNLCTVFVLPSCHEGFGLPALEAMSCGAATIGSSCTSVPEVIGRPDALFDPYDESAIRNLLCHVLCDEAFRSELIAHGLQHAKSFSWDKTAQRAIAAIEAIPMASGQEEPRIDAPPPMRQLVQRIAAVVPSNAPQLELLALAHAMSHVFNIQPAAPSVVATGRIFIDCTATQASAIHSGIERVVRNIGAHARIVGRPMGLKCELVRLTQIGYTLTSDHAIGTRPRSLQRVRIYANRLFTFCTRGLSRIAPQPLKKYLLSTRHEPGLARLIYILLRPVTGLGRLLSGLSSNRSANNLVTFQPGDILLLADSVWNYTPWPAVQAARVAGTFVAAVVYDIIPLTHPQFFAPVSREKFAGSIALLMQHADAFLSISAFTEMELRQHVKALGPGLPASPAYAHFALGAELDLRNASCKARKKIATIFAYRGPVYLAVGTLEPRKNHSYMLQSFQQLWDAGVDVSLLFVGRIGWMSDALLAQITTHPFLGQRLFFLEDANDCELDYCYSHARAVLLASVVEGFGLPLIEALRKGRPVFASDIPVFREVGGEYPVYYDLSSPDALFKALLDYETTGIFRGRNPGTFTWPSWSQSTRELLTKLLALHAASVNPRLP